jgi:hypothetical protein
MSRRMFRYVVPIDDRMHTCELNGDPRHVAASEVGDDVVEFWAENDDLKAVATRWFRVYGTGDALPGSARWWGTCDRTPDGYVWHLYEVRP